MYKYIQEDLKTTDGTEGSFLIPKKIYDTLIPAVDKTLLPRELAAIYIGPNQIPGSSVDLNLVSPDSMQVRIVGEGAEIYKDDPEFTSSNIKPVKYGVRVDITREMLEDSKWNLLQRAIEIAGKEMAENETNLIISESLDSAANTVAGGAAITIANITRGIQYLRDKDYEPTDLLLGPEVLNDLQNIDTFVEANKIGNTDMLKRGFLGTLYGMNVVLFSANAAPSTTYSKYAYVIDRKHAFVIVEKRPVTTEMYKTPTHDTEGVAITQRIKTKALRTNATCKITTT